MCFKDKIHIIQRCTSLANKPEQMEKKLRRWSLRGGSVGVSSQIPGASGGDGGAAALSVMGNGEGKLRGVGFVVLHHLF